MNKNNKYIDGLIPHTNKTSTRVSRGTVGFNTVRKKPTMRVVTKPTVVTAMTPQKKTRKTVEKPLVEKDLNDYAEERLKARKKSEKKNREEIVSDFVQPIESFDIEIDEGKKKLGFLKRKKSEEKPKKEKKKWSKKRKILTFGIPILLILAMVWFLIWGQALISNLTNGNSNIWDAFGVLGDNYKELRTDKNGRTNILIFGTSGMDMGGSGHDGAQLTDSIMILSVDQKNKDAKIINLPRDLKVSRTCTATGKVNEIYWCNYEDGANEEAGALALAEEVKDIFGIDIQYWAHLNWGALIQLVDSLGGITVTLDEDIEDYYTNTFISAGVPTELDGIKALGLARARHGTASGDFSRGNSQQKILIAIKNKISEKGLGIMDVIGILNILGDNLRTNFDLEEMKSAANLANKIDINNIQQIALLDPDNNINLLTTGTINGISYVLPSEGAGRYNELQTHIKKMLSNDPVVSEAANILVLNGAGVYGLASDEKLALTNDGFTVGYIDDAPEGEYSKPYYIYTINPAKSGTKKALEKRYKVKAKSAEKLPAGIYSDGFDFVVILGTPTTKE